MLRIAFALLLLGAASACDAFWEGPTLPGGATHIGYTVLSEQGPYSNLGALLVADTSLAGLRGSITQQTRQKDCLACWENIGDAPGHLYVAMTSLYYCGTIRETAALSQLTLYLIEWFGRLQRSCGDAYPMPHLRLLSFNRSDLPSTGRLTLDLQVQSGGTTTDQKIDVTLG